MSHDQTKPTEHTYKHTCNQSSMSVHADVHSDLLLVVEIIDSVASDDFVPSAGFRSAASGYLARHARKLAAGLLEQGGGCNAPTPSPNRP